MKNLKESLLDDEDILMDNTDQIKELIKKFIEKNFAGSRKYIINNRIVNIEGDLLARIKITHLTNGLFKWGTINGNFDLEYCTKLKTLEGGPEIVKGDFVCRGCSNLKTLEKAPKIVKGDFDCSECDELKTLEGAPTEVGGDFYCSCCDKLISFEGAPKKVNGNFICNDCIKLQSFKGAPEEINGHFLCDKAGNAFGDFDIRKYSKLKGNIYC